MGFLRQLIGPDKDEIWSQLSREIGADYQPGGFFTESRVVLSRAGWQIVLDTYRVSTGKSHATYTRMRAPFANPDGFRFNIHRKGLFSEIGKRLGMQDLEIGDSFFDDAFILQSNSEDRLRQLLVNSEIRARLQQEPGIHLEIVDDEGVFQKRLPEGVDELYFRVLGIVTDQDRLKNLFDLFAAVLDQLNRIGTAGAADPGLELP